MPKHICACFYGPTGKCIWCGSTEPLKTPHAIPGVQELPPVIHFYFRSQSKPVYGRDRASYVPFSKWGRENIRRSNEELLKQFLETEESCLEVLLKECAK